MQYSYLRSYLPWHLRSASPWLWICFNQSAHVSSAALKCFLSPVVSLQFPWVSLQMSTLYSCVCFKTIRTLCLVNTHCRHKPMLSPMVTMKCTWSIFTIYCFKLVLAFLRDYHSRLHHECVCCSCNHGKKPCCHVTLGIRLSFLLPSVWIVSYSAK